MNKLLQFPVFAAILLASCSKNEYAPSGVSVGTPISFTTNANDAPTRSGETKKSLESFVVTAQTGGKSVVLDEVLFSYRSATSTFESSTAFYWPTDETLSFYAISNPGMPATSEESVDGPVYSYTDWAGETDLVAATVKSGVEKTPYPLTFRHLTSQIRVSARAENQTEALTYKLLGVRMTTPCHGVYSFAAATGGIGTWTIDNDHTKQYSYADGIGSGLSFNQNGSATLPSIYWNILPNRDGKILFEVEYEIYQAGRRIGDYTGTGRKICTINSPNLEAGKAYTYNFLLSNTNSTVISFTAEMADWDVKAAEDKYLTSSEGIIEDLSPMNVEAVDLGLPSGVKWASMNVGATSPEERGLYFARGKTEGHNQNGIGDYVFPEFLAIAGSGNLSLESDAAHAYWKGTWRMPTYTEINELITYCTYGPATVNGVEGIKFTKGKGDAIDEDTYIFLPLTGLYSGELQNTHGGYYWSSTADGSSAKYLCFSSSTPSMANGSLWWGMAVRPVCE